MGTYNITKDMSDSVKFRAMVELNGKSEQYWECDSLIDSEISVSLQAVADQDLIDNTPKENLNINIIDGQIVV